MLCVLAIAGPGCAVFAAGDSAAQPAAPVCTALARAVEDSEKEIAYLRAEGRSETSASRSSARASELAGEMQRLAANLDLMRDHRCPAYPHAISAEAFREAAENCMTNVRALQMVWAKTDQVPACDRSRWGR